MLLPAFWLALHGTRAQMIAAVVGVAVTFIGPLCMPDTVADADELEMNRPLPGVLRLILASSGRDSLSACSFPSQQASAIRPSAR